LDLDLARHKEFRFSRDGAYVAVGIWQSNTKPEVCAIRVADGKRLGGRGTCGGGGAEAVEMSTLPVKPGYTKVEVQMPKDDGKRPASVQER
jgi:hypothetical protein